MTLNDQIDLKSFHRTNLVLWIIILSSILIIAIVIFILDHMKINQLIETNPLIEKLLFLFAIAFALTIILLKRSIFHPSNIVNSIKNNVESDQYKILLFKLRRNYIIVWSLGELICIVGLVDYFLFIRINSFLVYSAVSIYSIIINIPRITIIEKCINLIKAN